MARALNRRISILRRNDTRTSAGGSRPDWLLHVEVYSSVEFLTGQTLIAAQAEATRADVKFRIRWRSEIKPRLFRVEWEGRQFEIIHVAEARERRGFLMLLGREIE